MKKPTINKVTGLNVPMEILEKVGLHRTVEIDAFQCAIAI